MTEGRSEHEAVPPVAASWLVRRLCPAERWEELEGDLHELFTQRVGTHGASVARRAYWRDALGLCVHGVRLRHRGRGTRARGAGGLRVHTGRILFCFGVLGVVCGTIAVVCGLLGFAYSQAWVWASGALFLAGDPLFTLLSVIMCLQRERADAREARRRCDERGLADR